MVVLETEIRGLIELAHAVGDDVLLTQGEQTLQAHVLTCRRIERRGQPPSLPEAEVDYLLSMESGHYRAKIAAGSAEVM